MVKIFEQQGISKAYTIKKSTRETPHHPGMPLGGTDARAKLVIVTS